MRVVSYLMIYLGAKILKKRLKNTKNDKKVSRKANFFNISPRFPCANMLYNIKKQPLAKAKRKPYTLRFRYTATFLMSKRQCLVIQCETFPCWFSQTLPWHNRG